MSSNLSVSRKSKFAGVVLRVINLYISFHFLFLSLVSPFKCNFLCNYCHTVVIHNGWLLLLLFAVTVAVGDFIVLVLSEY